MLAFTSHPSLCHSLPLPVAMTTVGWWDFCLQVSSRQGGPRGSPHSGDRHLLRASVRWSLLLRVEDWVALPLRGANTRWGPTPLLTCILCLLIPIQVSSPFSYQAAPATPSTRLSVWSPGSAVKKLPNIRHPEPVPRALSRKPGPVSGTWLSSHASLVFRAHL